MKIKLLLLSWAIGMLLWAAALMVPNGEPAPAVAQTSPPVAQPAVIYCNVDLGGGRGAAGVVVGGQCQRSSVSVAGGNFAGTSSMNGTVWTVTSSSNAIAISSGTITARAPELWMSCDADACVARGLDAERAKAMLERIANRSMRVEVVVHDAACNAQREMIEPRPRQDLVAEAR